MHDSTRDLLTAVGQVLLRCWLIGFGLLFIWAGVVWSGVVYRLHGPLLGLSAADLQLVHYCGMGLFKLAMLTLFFFPWLSIQLVLRKPKL